LLKKFLTLEFGLRGYSVPRWRTQQLLAKCALLLDASSTIDAASSSSLSLSTSTKPLYQLYERSSRRLRLQIQRQQHHNDEDARAFVDDVVRRLVPLLRHNDSGKRDNNNNNNYHDGGGVADEARVYVGSSDGGDALFVLASKQIDVDSGVVASILASVRLLVCCNQLFPIFDGLSCWLASQ
jgi:hypothetical protein